MKQGKERNLTELFLLGFDQVLNRKGRTYMFNEEDKVLAIVEPEGNAYYVSPFLGKGYTDTNLTELKAGVSYMQEFPEMMKQQTTELNLRDLNLLTPQEKLSYLNKVRQNVESFGLKYSDELGKRALESKEKEILTQLPSGVKDMITPKTVQFMKK